ncbi:DNA double-strand break repair nuclease NurA [Candidatus Babeliales bacterium]|nr:DNA double-strand break repair nuclease NurA [Candidatus Babeliales bacterium]
MLDRAQLLKAFQEISSHLFQDTSHAQNIARTMWEMISDDPLFIHKIKSANAPWILPTWDGSLSAVFDASLSLPSYQVAAVDGSQVYPDRHQGVGCYLLNVGEIHLSYGFEISSMRAQTHPYVFTLYDDDTGIAQTVDMINAKREAYELDAGVTLGMRLKAQNGQMPYCVLYDGSLIFWHLESKDNALREKFLSSYLQSLERMYQERIPMASYISSPKSKELVNLVRVALCNFTYEGCTAHHAVDGLVDAHIVRSYLSNTQRTAIFYNHSPITRFYPEHLRPCFVYLNVGREIGRVETPSWVAQDTELLDRVVSIVANQALKGRGYPVCLSEAHEQAVIKGPDREFFYHILQKAGIANSRSYQVSEKALRKLRIGI